ncbi:MAG: hypothetical protein JO112_19095, partial [Planctomycetes bacterium]|nr:hypothetical protein [Planctomycetota bacterium]
MDLAQEGDKSIPQFYLNTDMSDDQAARVIIYEVTEGKFANLYGDWVREHTPVNASVQAMNSEDLQREQEYLRNQGYPTDKELWNQWCEYVMIDGGPLTAFAVPGGSAPEAIDPFGSEPNYAEVRQFNEGVRES